MRPTPIIHVGMVKTGTTSLKTDFFSQKEEFLYLDQPGGLAPVLFKALEVDIFQKPDMVYEQDAVREPVLEEYDRLCAANPGKTPVIFSVLAYSDIIQGADLTHIPARLKYIFGDCKIIMTIRRQDTFTVSRYAQKVTNSGAYFTFRQFLEYNERLQHLTFFSVIRYLPLLDEYADVFGRNNILVLCYEELKYDPDLFFKKLAEFCGIDYKSAERHVGWHNKHFGRTSVQLKRILNWLIPYDHAAAPFMPPLRWPGEKAHVGIRLRWQFTIIRLLRWLDNYLPFNEELTLPAGWPERIQKIFGESNRILQAKYGLPLEQYGYPMPISSTKNNSKVIK